MTLKNLITAVFLLFSTISFAQEPTYQLSSHILDITTGKPAGDVKITLSRQDKNEKWQIVEEKFTDNNGRVKDFLKKDGENKVGIYKLTFHTNSYFKKLGQSSFYPFIDVVFELKDNEHYHVPITLSPFGYSTYRGS